MMTATLLLLGLTMLLYVWPDLPVSRWLAPMLVEAPARRLNRVRPGHWAMIVAGVALIGLAIWFEIDEIRMLAMAGGSMGDLVMIASTIEWGGVAELGMATILSSSMLARWPVFRRWAGRLSAGRAARPRRAERPANDTSDGEGRRLAA
ncbi:MULTISPECIES: hypothetical protein [Sphingomonas]|jgi:hypothetical protein|uniref:Uncharacterized protein n=1 Tax=Sphingomonas zeae TaxID=1646122 RepID=A0A7Y6EJ60_9SPHN|nr:MULTISPECIES: hypothetical protein [Sphingomonas]MBB4046754.1 hypothetical protein [Sphingomonas zeae]MDK8184530.1 hypothetical protein [Sphingomonas zeae]MDK8214381.1 hypothetical protein [Sphingomonas sp. UMB7805-LC452B]NUU48862.1 hypothetical protein [Sphingomonas zeae]